MIIIWGVILVIVLLTIYLVVTKRKKDKTTKSKVNKETMKTVLDNAHLNYLSMPLVSAICVTRNRVPFLKRAVRDFLDQTYPNKELVIVYDNDDTETNTFIQSITFPIIAVKNDKKIKLGSLRNLGIQSANGEYIIQWDDDDEYNPKRIEKQLKILQNYGKKACCLARWLIYDNHTNKRYISSHYTWEGSILAEKNMMLEYPYPDMSKGEDTVVIEALKKDDQLILADIPELYTYHLHWKNTWDRDHGESIIANSHLTD